MEKKGDSKPSSGLWGPRFPIPTPSTNISRTDTVEVHSLFFDRSHTALFLRLGDYLLCDLSGHFVVVIQLHRIRAARAGDRVQRRLIRKHLGQRNLGLYDRLVPFAVHSLNSTAPRIDISENVAGRLLRNRYLDVHYRFEQHRFHLLHRASESLAPGELEGKIVRVDR